MAVIVMQIGRMGNLLVHLSGNEIGLWSALPTHSAISDRPLNQLQYGLAARDDDHSGDRECE